MADAKPLVLVTGCAGFIGSAVVKRLMQHYRVIGLDMKEPGDCNIDSNRSWATNLFS